MEYRPCLRFCQYCSCYFAMKQVKKITGDTRKTKGTRKGINTQLMLHKGTQRNTVRLLKRLITFNMLLDKEGQVNMLGEVLAVAI